ncbi:hypothetical protein N665_0007s0013 [Sinapis alba]|nr:hypothetical protein N665_0007s0013 [Sinapis alba]
MSYEICLKLLRKCTSSSMPHNNASTEITEWPALSTKDIGRKKDQVVVDRSKTLKQTKRVDDSLTQRIKLPTDKVRFPWAARMNPQTRNLHRVIVPEYMEGGTPKSTRKFVLQRGLWHVDDCIMFVAPWTSSESLTLPKITSIQVWVKLKNIPSTLYSILGIEWIDSGLGEPMLSYKPWLDPTMLGEAKIMVEVELDKPFPQKVAAWDKQGDFSLVDVEYSWIPTSCERCGQLGHKSKRCLSISDDLKVPAETSQNANAAKRDELTSDNSVPTQDHPRMPITMVQSSNSQQHISHAPAAEITATNCNEDITPHHCLEEGKVSSVVDKVNSTKVDELVSLATISVLENMYESPTIICINETTEASPTESAPTKQKHESLVNQTSTVIDLGSNKFASRISFEGEEKYQMDVDECSDPIDVLTTQGKRLLRERPVKPSAKAMECQMQSTSRGRGNRGWGNRGRLR